MKWTPRIPSKPLRPLALPAQRLFALLVRQAEDQPADPYVIGLASIILMQ